MEKKSLSNAWVWVSSGSTLKCDGLSTLDYNDGYIYDNHALNLLNHYGFSDLVPLGDAITVNDVFTGVPEEVWTNEEAPLLVNLYIYTDQINEHAKYEESWHESAINAAKHTVIVTYKIR